MLHFELTTLATSRSMAASFETGAIDVRGITIAAFEIEWSGADATDATIKLQGSVTGVNWCDIENSSTTISAAAGDALWELHDIGVARVRAVFTANTNTTGTISIIGATKADRSGDSPGGRAG